MKDTHEADFAARLAAVEKENAGLRARISELETALPIKQILAHAPVVKEERRPFQTFDLSEKFVMPSDSDLRRLYDLTRARFPKQAAAGEPQHWNDDQLFPRFVSAFRFVGDLRRTEQTDKQHAISWWLDQGKNWLTARQISPSTLRGPDFLLACIAHNDVAFIPANEQGQMWEVGVDMYNGKRPSGAWREALAGRIRASTPPRPVPAWDIQLKVSGVW
jgi:hypothetical protein